MGTPIPALEENLVRQIDRIISAHQDAVSELARIRDRAKADPLYAVSEVARSVRGVQAQVDFGVLAKAAHEVLTITEESIAASIEEDRKADEAKTPQWFDGEKWYLVTARNTDGSRSHYFVNGAGSGDGAICGRATYSHHVRCAPVKPICKRCDQEMVLR